MRANVDEESCKEFMGIDVFEQEYRAISGLYRLSPERAKYILQFLNNDNRKIRPGVVKELHKSIEEDGWQNDGDTLRFNKEGNITEFQHRLMKIAAGTETYYVPLVLGVEPESFTKTAKTLQRSAYDEMYRGDKSTTPDEAAVLSKIRVCEGQPSNKQLSVKNAAQLHTEYKKDIRESFETFGERLFVQDKGIMKDKGLKYFSQVKELSKWKRLIIAVVTLCIIHDEKQLATIMLKQLKDTMVGGADDATPLAKNVYSLIEDQQTSYISDVKMTKYVYMILCRMLDRLKDHPNGDCTIGLKFVDFNSKDMKTRGGFYYKFLVNPQDLDVEDEEDEDVDLSSYTGNVEPALVNGLNA